MKFAVIQFPGSNCDIDLYDDQVTFLQKRFPSPIGSTAISFYHFYIEDTVAVAGDS